MQSTAFRSWGHFDLPAQKFKRTKLVERKQKVIAEEIWNDFAVCFRQKVDVALDLAAQKFKKDKTCALETKNHRLRDLG